MAIRATTLPGQLCSSNKAGLHGHAPLAMRSLAGGRVLRSLPPPRRHRRHGRMPKMSDAVKDNGDVEKVGGDNGGPFKEENLPPPPDNPPEKPLPGDCCGSGCVRCVWDIYYDELEEYNNRKKKMVGDSGFK